MITREFVARLKRVDATDVDVPVNTTFSYDAGTDPYAVQAIFQVGEDEERVWHFSRELLSAGAYSMIPLGHGDVKFRYFPGPAAVLMCLRTKGMGVDEPTHADIALPVQEVVGFLNDTQELYKEASHDCSALVDDFLKELFEA